MISTFSASKKTIKIKSNNCLEAKGLSDNDLKSKVNTSYQSKNSNKDSYLETKKKRRKRKRKKGSVNGNTTSSSTYPTNSAEETKVHTRVTLKLSTEFRKFLSFERNKTLIKIESGFAGNKRNVNLEPYYHGFMSRDVAEKIKMSNGQFLLRRAEIEKRQIYIITVHVNDKREHHMIMRTNDGKHFWIKKYCFNSVSDLIRYHMDRLIPIKDGVKITHWVDKDLWLLTHDQIRLQKPIGSGAFGMVFVGFLNLGTFRQSIPVAIKLLKMEKMTNDSKLEFLREASIMTEFNSEYVIKFFGVCTQRDPVMIILEMATNGSLYDNLKNPKIKDPILWNEKKHKYARHVNLGLQYIHSKETLHRDIATRNVLIGGDDKAKIADFGLSLRQTSIVMKEMKKMPIRWLPPETLSQGLYSPRSEVWSYGVLIYEIYTDGKRPYENISNNKELIKKITKGTISLLNYSEVEKFPDDIKTILKSCLAREPSLRLFMKDLYECFNKFDGLVNTNFGNSETLKYKIFGYVRSLKEYIFRHFL
ncbi:Tyrosine-protein kinase Fps85D [Strongyloides ratti]|uniref:Tyrosine-protein kinase n=1 Tax=Strongyloides ratti TaxID=34506 RepID=A0A090LGX0_STRRB|nr:Tyrosine-protein kinase Fps85D [Strongyloides ratti]CEF66705.1 Tyrosine-protein kinase Fps85D [Strongyloides ratti]